MAMAYSTMVTRVGEMLNQDVSDDTGTVTNTEVKAWLNIGYQKARNSVVAMGQNFQMRLTKANLVSGQSYYALPSDCRKVVRVEVGFDSADDREKAQRIDVNQINDPDLTFSEGAPLYYVTGNQIRIFPEPGSALTNGLWLEYIEDPGDMSADADTPSLPVGYDHVPLLYAVAKGKYKLGLKTEAEVTMEEFHYELETMKDEVIERNLDGHDTVIVRTL